MQELTVDRKLGHGSFANVFLLKSECSRLPLQYALKIIDQDQFRSEEDRIKSVAEAKLMLRLQHDHIVSCYDAFQFDSHLLLITEFCSGGDMYCYLNNRKDTSPLELITEEQIMQWIHEISSGLQYLHNLKILHRDIKTKNIFLQDNLTVQIGDLGIAKQLDFTLAKANTFLGTPMYMCPEIFRFQPYSYKADVWSFGCCVYEMMTLRFAFESVSHKNLMQKIMHGELPQVPSIYSDGLAVLAQSMMSSEPEDRPRASEIQHSAQRYLRNAALKKIPPRQRRRLPNDVDVCDTVGAEQRSTSDRSSLDRRDVINALLAYFKGNVTLGIHSGFEHKTFADSKAGLSKTVKSITTLQPSEHNETLFTRDFGISEEIDVDSGEEFSFKQHNFVNSDKEFSVRGDNCVSNDEEFSVRGHNCVSNGGDTDWFSVSQNSKHSNSGEGSGNLASESRWVLPNTGSLSYDNQARLDHTQDKEVSSEKTTLESQVSNVIRWAMENLATCSPERATQIDDDENKPQLVHHNSVPDMKNSERKVRKKKKNFLRAYSERINSSSERKKSNTEITEPSLTPSKTEDAPVTLYTRSQKVMFRNSSMEEIEKEDKTELEDCEHIGSLCEQELGRDMLSRACQLVQLVSDDNLLQAQLRDLLGWRNFKKYRKHILRLARSKNT